MTKRHGNVKDLTGQVFGRLTVLEYAGQDANWHSMWKVMCSCGEVRTVCGGDLTSGNTNSCGCLRAELTKGNKRGLTHGHTQRERISPEYISWRSMKARCTNPNAPNWNNYGGRGVRICTRWLNSFSMFLKDMGRRPKGKTLDRSNPNGHYVPSNGRWSTAKQQNNNRRQRGSLEPVIAFVDVK